MKLLRNNRGDTIIEVLIAIAVVSSVIGGAYIVTNRTLANSRQAQEHSEALQIASEQVERIIGFATSDPDNLFDFTADTWHCASRTTGLLVNFIGEENAPAECKGFGTNGFYTAIFTYNVAQNDTFLVKVTWDSAASGQDQVNLVYRPYQP